MISKSIVISTVMLTNPSADSGENALCFYFDVNPCSLTTSEGGIFILHWSQINF